MWTRHNCKELKISTRILTHLKTIFAIACDWPWLLRTLEQSDHMCLQCSAGGTRRCCSHIVGRLQPWSFSTPELLSPHFYHVPLLARTITLPQNDRRSISACHYARSPIQVDATRLSKITNEVKRIEKTNTGGCPQPESRHTKGTCQQAGQL
jgi:hypothetical protein